MGCAGAQAQERVAWTLQAEPATVAPGGSTLVRATAQVQAGWHLYSASSPTGIPAAFQVEPGTLVRVLQPPPKRAFDKNFNAESETYEGEVAFLLEVKLPRGIPAGPASLAVKVRYQTCND
ncbi:MAG: protein-disulfide reductase DsbD N-terminal domain-containing protein, partial [Acidobacteriia bacterium]|nr:protein-disulfide reductase DsbD N-terminal domain-containing protein [Terriglobia bacterium]